VSSENSYQNLEYRLENHVAWVRLNHPPVNALSRQMVAELTSMATALAADDNVWLVAVTAAGKAFCAGADLKERRQIPEDQVATVVKDIQRMVFAWWKLPQPVVVGVQGPALGGGLEFVLAADLVAASETAQLGFTEVRLAVIPGAGGTQLSRWKLGLSRAGKWILSGRRFSAREALADGVIHWVFPPEEFEAEFQKLVEELAQGAPVALRQAKKALRAEITPMLEKGLEMESQFYQGIIETADRREALEAFLAKRKPRWRGK